MDEWMDDIMYILQSPSIPFWVFFGSYPLLLSHCDPVLAVMDDGCNGHLHAQHPFSKQQYKKILK